MNKHTHTHDSCLCLLALAASACRLRVCCCCRSLSSALHTNASGQRLHTNCPCYAAGPAKKRRSKTRYRPKSIDPELFSKIWGTPAESLHALSAKEKLARSCVHHEDLHRWVALTAAAVSSLCLPAAICLPSERERE